MVAVCDRIESIARIVEGHPDIRPNQRFDVELRGDIRVCGNVFQESVPDYVGLTPLGDGDYTAQAVRVRGLEFDLPDPRQLDHFSRELSFVFAEFRDAQGPSWHLVQVIPREDTFNYIDTQIHGAEICLRHPLSMFRYCYEHFMDTLLRWLKRYYLPVLFFSRYDDLSDYERFADLDPGDLQKREEMFDTLVQQVKREASLD